MHAKVFSILPQSSQFRKEALSKLRLFFHLQYQIRQKVFQKLAFMGDLIPKAPSSNRIVEKKKTENSEVFGFFIKIIDAEKGT